MRSSMVLLWIAACGGGKDDGSAGTPDAAACGDGTVAAGEACDDGNGWGGDGCSATCTVEDGTLEVEPNDAPDQAQAGTGPFHGALPTGDRDCFAIDVGVAGAVRVSVRSSDGGCMGPMALELWGFDGVRATVGLPDLASGCPAIEPDTDVWARYLDAGTVAVCVAPIDALVPDYVLTLETLDSCAGLPPVTLDPSQDLEGDGNADVCDDDDDDDGVPDTSDNCPAAPNGPAAPFPWSTADDGFVELWMVLGPFTDGVTLGGCEPSPDSFAGPNDADVAAVFGDPGWFAWFAWPGADPTLRYTTWFDATPAPREAYAATWIGSPDDRTAELAMGADDGSVVWVNGVEVGRDGGCHGVGTDAFRYPVDLVAGWNRVLVKVYDGGGGWGQVVRFYQPDGVTPMTDLDVSLAPAPWADDQGDRDGDGIGDLCDPEP